MMAADYRHIDGLENRLGRHYSRFPPCSPTPALADQSLALRKLCDAGSNRRSRVRWAREPFDFRDQSQVRNELAAAAEVPGGNRADQAGQGALERFGSREGQLVGAV